jgi:hypothetical protein
MQHVEATSGASRAARGCTGKLAAHGEDRVKARVKTAVAGEGIPAEEGAATTPSAAADKPRKTLSA